MNFNRCSNSVWRFLYSAPNIIRVIRRRK